MVKNTKFSGLRGKKALNKRFSWLFLVVGIVLVTVVLAGIYMFGGNDTPTIYQKSNPEILEMERQYAEFKTYDPIEREVTIKDPLKPEVEVGKAKLLTPLHKLVGGGHGEHAFEIELYLPTAYESPMDKIHYYEKYRNGIIGDKISSPNWELKVYNPDGEYEVEKPVYETNCIPNKNPENKSETCTYDLVKTNYETKYGTWDSLSKTGNLDAGTYRIRGYYNERFDGIIEFVPEIFGIPITEWAAFENVYSEENHTTPFTTANDGFKIYQGDCVGTANCISQLITMENDCTLAGVQISIHDRDSAGVTAGSVCINNATSTNAKFEEPITCNDTVADYIITGGAELADTVTPINFSMPTVTLHSGETYAISFQNFSMGGAYARTTYDYQNGKYRGNDNATNFAVRGDGVAWATSDMYFHTFCSFAPADAAPEISLDYPEDNQVNQTTNNIRFIGTCNDDVNCENITLVLDSANNYTQTSTGNFSFNYTINSLEEGNHNYTFTACDNASQCTTNSTIYEINITDTPYFTAVANQEFYNNTALAYDVNAADDLGIVDTIYINWTGTFSMNRTGYLTNVSALTSGEYYILVSVNDTIGNTNSTTMLVNVTDSPMVFYNVWGEKQVYDEIDDSLVNASLWVNTTSGAGDGDITIITDESADYLRSYVECKNTHTSKSGYANVDSHTYFPNLDYVENVTVRAYARVTGRQGDSWERMRSQIDFFGTEIIDYYCNDGVGECNDNDDSVYTLYRNYSEGDDKWSVYDDGVFLKTFTATDREFYTYASVGVESGDCSDDNIGEARIYYVYYTYSNGTLNITQNSPDDAENILSTSSVTFNSTATTQINNLANASLYLDGIYNDSVSLTGTTDEAIITKSFSNEDYNWTMKVCDTSNNCIYSPYRTFTISGVSVLGESYETSVFEGESTDFQLNLTTPFAGQRVSTGTLIYNNTNYSGTIVDLGGDNYSISRTISTPIVTSDTEIPFYWYIILEDNSEFNQTTHNQTVQNLQIDDCSAHSVLIVNMSHKDEESKTVLNGTTYNTTVEVDLDLYSSGGSTPLIEYSNRYKNETNPQICVAELNATYDMYLEIMYDGDSYAEEFYHIQNFTLQNSSIPQNIDLYDIDDSNGQEFKITYKDENFLPVEDALIQIQRKYIGDGIFRVIEIPKTDKNGETVASLRIDDAVYTFVVTQYGETLATFNDMRVYCQNPTLEECTISLNSLGTSLGVEDYTKGDDLTFTMTYNKTARVITSTFSIPSGASTTMLLNATLFDNTGKTEVCSDTLTSSSGTLTCTVPTSYENTTVVAKLTKAGELQGLAYIPIDNPEPIDLYGFSLVFIGLILLLTLIGIAVIDSPMITGLFLIIGAVLLLLMNIINGDVNGYAIGGSIAWIAVAILLVLIKGAKRQ